MCFYFAYVSSSHYVPWQKGLLAPVCCSDRTLLALCRLFGSFIGAKIKNLLAGICGKAKESPKAPPAEGSTPKAPEEDERIVNGWDAPARPFLALIRAVDPKDADIYETCGGAVLNRWEDQ